MGEIINQLKYEWKDKPIRYKLLALIGGVDTTLFIFTPIILSALWVIVNGLNDWTSYFFYVIGLIATAFRAIKIGWMK